jgi:DNA-binding LacI/PurR family transcriptional regulator
MKNTPNIQMICDQLGLSKATVSKALNGYPQVSLRTREAVRRYAEEIGYRLDKPAAAQPNAAVRRIGMPGRVPGSERTDFSGDYQVMAGFRDEAQRHGMEIILLPSFITPVQIQTSLESLIEPYQLDGILISGLRTDDPYMTQLQSVKIPAVLWDLKIAPNPSVGTVCYDSLRGAQMAVEYLFSLGHRRIAIFNGHRYAQVSYERLDGYRLALVNAGITPDPKLEVWGDFTETGAEEAAELFIEQGVTAVFCACDTTAIGLIRQLKAKGKRVPRDVSVVGYDDSPLSSAVSPALTTVSQDFYRIGQVACGMMNALLQGLQLHCETVLPKLVVRDSTGPAPAL